MPSTKAANAAQIVKTIAQAPEVLLLTDQNINNLPIPPQSSQSRCQKQLPSQSRRRDIPYFRNSASTQKSPTNLQSEHEVCPFQMPCSDLLLRTNNSGHSTQATSNVTLERAKTQDFFKCQFQGQRPRLLPKNIKLPCIKNDGSQSPGLISLSNMQKD